MRSSGIGGRFTDCSSPGKYGSEGSALLAMVMRVH